MGDRNMPRSDYLSSDRNMVLPCFKIHRVAMFRGVEASTMAPTNNFNNGKEQMKLKKNMNVK